MLLKKLFFVFALISVFSFSVYSAEEPKVSVQCAVLINAHTKEILYEKNAYTPHSMASTTKIMTAVLAIESGRLSQIVKAENMEAEGSSIGLENGNRLTLETLVWGMLLESGNDAAKLTANFISGNEERFAVLMNNKASEIGMTDTSFVTSSGLDDQYHYSNAFDMALLGAYAINNPIFREICSTKTKTVRFIEPDISKTFSNHNKLLSYYDGAIGIKTGFTKKSGRCLVSACERDGDVLVAVTLNAGDDWNDHMKMYDYGFEVSVNKEVFIRLPENIRVYGGANSFTEISLNQNPVNISIKDSSEITQHILLPAFIYAPVNKGDIIGKIRLLNSGRVIEEFNIYAETDVAALNPLPEKENLFKRIINKLINL